MSELFSNPSRVTKRCLRACSRCRDMKVRCSGNVPCLRCQRKREVCFYKPEDARVTVSQSYLQSLQDRAKEVQNPPSSSGSPLHSHRTIKSSSLPSSGSASTLQLRQLSQRDTEGSRPVDASAHREEDQNDSLNNFQTPNQESSSLGEHRRYPEEPYQQSVGPSSNDPIASPDFARNPLVDNGETFARDPHGKYWYMGPTSSWAFCRRVLGIIGSRMPRPEPPVDPWDLETLDLTWNPVGFNQQPDINNLPARDYAVLLLSTVQYHLGSLYDIIDHVSFQQQLDHFYEDPVTVSNRSRFWYSQFLFVLAFGEVFVSTGSSKSVPGIGYASRALALIPSIIPLDKNSSAAVEALCLASLYLQAVDLRLMAFQLIGQALRLCIIEGWHRHMPLEDVGIRHSQRCNTLFWTAYIIDREFGALVGATSSIRDEDITAKLPSDVNDSPRTAALTLQIKLARLTAKILTGVYGVDRNFDGTLLNDTQAVLHSIADVSKDLSFYLETKLQGIDVRTSKIATRLILAYHHCVVLSTRPLVMCVLQRRLASDNFDKSIPDGPIHSLLESCAYSALNILRTLRGLGDRNLLDFFIPFQLETAFSSTFLLYVLDAVSPGFIQDSSWLAIAHEIFDMMIARGSPAAKLRKRECQRLEQIMCSYLQQGSSEPNSIPQFSETLSGQKDVNVSNQTIADSIVETASSTDFSSWGLLDVDGGFPMSPNEILNLAEELQVGDFMVSP